MAIQAAVQASYPVPIGPGVSFSNVTGTTPSFSLQEGVNILVFHPRDVNCPGTLTLYDVNGNAQATMNTAGYSSIAVPPGGASGYYFDTGGTTTADLVAAIRPLDSPARL